MKDVLKYILGVIAVIAVIAAWVAWSVFTAPPCSEARQGDNICYGGQ